MIESVISGKSGKDCFFAMSSRCDNFVTKCAALKYVNDLNIKPLLRMGDISATLVRPCVRNVPGKMDEAKSVGYIHGKAVQRVSKDQVL